MIEFSDEQFNETLEEAAKEGAKDIENLALAIAGRLTKIGIKIKGQALFERLNSIIQEHGISEVPNRLKLDEIIDQCKNEIVNPENIYEEVLMNAYVTAVNMRDDVELQDLIENIANEFSRAFREQGKHINATQILSQMNNVYNYQVNLDSKNDGYYNQRRSAINMISKPYILIQNLCIQLQLAGLLD